MFAHVLNYVYLHAVYMHAHLPTNVTYIITHLSIRSNLI